MKKTYSELDVLIVGSAGIDTSVFFPEDGWNHQVESNFTSDIDYVGQAGGYCSRSMAQLGLRTGYIGYIGNDWNGEFIRHELETDGVECLFFIDPAGTQRSVNLMAPDGSRRNFYDGRGTHHLIPDLESCAALIRKSRLVHFSIQNWCRRLLPIAAAERKRISCDIQDVVDISDPYRQNFIDAAEILFFSSVNLKDPDASIRFLMERNPSQVIICGMGKQGCKMGLQGQIRAFPAVELDRPIIDTNGAGDGLACGFLAAYGLDGYSPEDAVLRAQITARYTCSLRASSSNLIRREQLDAYYRQLKS
ncbi:MAG: carbohydrate kinase family protein [Candidatus Delongbacteria bacterium]|nr:carbohydrate kinase family protein [Candidatus Delongbacteria bacterium]